MPDTIPREVLVARLAVTVARRQPGVRGGRAGGVKDPSQPCAHSGR